MDEISCVISRQQCQAERIEMLCELLARKICEPELDLATLEKALIAATNPPEETTTLGRM